VATGDLFRAHLTRETELGKRAKTYMDEGQLVPDDLVTQMLFDRVEQEDCREGFLLDGFPRTMPQARSLETGIEGRWTLRVILLEVHDEVLVERAAGRLICRSCGKVHSTKSSPPQVEGRCDRCKGELYRRSDDSPEVMRESLQVYRNQTQPLVAWYEERGLLARVNGERSRDAVHHSLRQLIGEAA
jgi:adenylate kinase